MHRGVHGRALCSPGPDLSQRRGRPARFASPGRCDRHPHPQWRRPNLSPLPKYSATPVRLWSTRGLSEMTVYARPTTPRTGADHPPSSPPTKPVTKTTPHNTNTNPSFDRVRGRGAQDRVRVGGGSATTSAVTERYCYVGDGCHGKQGAGQGGEGVLPVASLAPTPWVDQPLYRGGTADSLRPTPVKPGNPGVGASVGWLPPCLDANPHSDQ